MKILQRFIAVMLFVFLATSVSAQSRQQLKTDSVFRVFKNHFNAKDINAIYALAGAKLKAAVSLQAFKNAIELQLFPMGEIKAEQMISFVNNKIATYKLPFKSETMQLVMDLDDQDKLEIFSFKPYTDVVVTTKPKKAPTSNPMASVTDLMVDSLARVYIQRSNTVGLSIGIIKDGKTNIYHYGEVKKGSNRLPDNSTLYELGSITKTFTATLLAWYVDQGKVSLQDPITKFLPTTVAANPQLKDITLLNLINHTSGLPGLPDDFTQQRPYDEANPYKNYSKQLLFDYLARATLNSKPGEKYVYSNLAVGVLGIILEKISGKTFEQMVAEVITGPLGMKNTVQHLYPMQAPRLAEVYDAAGKPTSVWDLETFASAGALRSTISDMLLYTKANLNANDVGALNKAINLTHRETLNNDARVGLAWHIMVVGGVEYDSHSGGTGGSSSFLAFNKAKGIGVIILSNAVESTETLGVNLLKKLQ